MVSCRWLIYSRSIFHIISSKNTQQIQLPIRPTLKSVDTQMEMTKQLYNKPIKRTRLFLIEILERILEAFFESHEGEVGFDGPPDLYGTQRNLGGRFKHPDLARFLLVRHDGFTHLVSNCLPHVVQQTIQPDLNLQQHARGKRTLQVSVFT